MDSEKLRKLQIEDYKAFLLILDSKGVAFTPPYTDEELEKLPLSDVKRLASTVRDLARTPTGGQ
jgi:hypothetical protein